MPPRPESSEWAAYVSVADIPAYPGDPKIYLPGEVPGSNLPAAFIGD